MDARDGPCYGARTSLLYYTSIVVLVYPYLLTTGAWGARITVDMDMDGTRAPTAGAGGGSQLDRHQQSAKRAANPVHVHLSKLPSHGLLSTMKHGMDIVRSTEYTTRPGLYSYGVLRNGCVAHGRFVHGTVRILLL